ncbi:prominin-1-like isoform X2 [Copidosoma floridanum]|nr:prominin-1-like isoform X2 [Copidosoma floridanum]
MVLGLSFATLSSLAVRRGTRELPDHLDNATEDLQVYSTGIIAEMDVLLIDNFHKLAEELISMLNRCSEWVINKLMEWGPRISDVFDKLEEMVNGLKDVEKSLGSIIEIVLSLKQEATIVDNEFSTIKDKLISVLEFNGNEESKRIQDEIKSYSIKTAEILEKLPVDDVKNAQSKIKELFDKGILSNALKGREELEKIKSEIQQKVDLSVSKIVDNVSDVSQNLTKVFKNETKWINETLSELVDNHTKPAINDIRLNIDKYSAYWHIFGIVVCSTILVISVLVLFGAMCGMCDKNPKDYDKGCGSCFLTTAVWMIFCVTSILVVLNVAHMLVGILSERMVCESLKNPRDSQIVQVASKTIYIGSLEYGSLLSPNWSLHDLIDSCRENNALAKGLKLEEATITGVWRNYTDSYDIDKRIDDLVNGINLNFDYELMNNGTKEQLREFANGAVNEINFEEIDKVLKQNFTGFDSHEFAEKLRSFSEKLPDGHPSRSEVVKCAQDLEKLGERIVNMTNQGRGLIGTVERLREQIKFNATSIQEAIENLIEDVEGAQHWVNHNATTSIKELATIFGTSLKNRVDEFLTHVSSNVAQKVGRCAPLSNLYDATIVAGCDKILDPFNGYWLSVGWCLFLFVPMVIFSVKFISLQKRPYIDSKYLFVG